jgi:hypothetical protein
MQETHVLYFPEKACGYANQRFRCVPSAGSSVGIFIHGSTRMGDGISNLILL